MNSAAGSAMQKYPRLKTTGTRVASLVLMRNILEKAPTIGEVTLLAKPHSAKHSAMSVNAAKKPFSCLFEIDLFSRMLISKNIYFAAKLMFFLQKKSFFTQKVTKNRVFVDVFVETYRCQVPAK
jgi:hypothetical protein